MGDSVIEVNTPTKSELATFQVLANMDFVNMDKGFPEHEQAKVRVVEDDGFDELPHKSMFEKFDENESQHSRSPMASPEIPVPREPVREPMREPREYKSSEATKSEIEAEKEALLAEIHNLERQGVAKLVRPLTMSDSLEEIQFQYDRIQAEVNAVQMVEFAKSAIKMGSGMAEMYIKKSGIKAIDGYHDNLCKDMNKFNRPLGRLYKKYWRRGGMSPEMELGMIIFGSLAWTVVQNKMGGGSDVPTPVPTPAARPPQMNSLNVPSQWGEEADMDTKESKMDVKMREMEQLQAKLIARETKLQNLQASLEARESANAQHESARYRHYESEESDVEPETRRVTLAVSPRKNASSRKKQVALNLDD